MKTELNKAKKYFAKQDYLKAKELLEQQYLSKKTFEINYLLAQAYFQLGQAFNAYQLASEYMVEYLQDEVKLTFYVSLGVAAKQILKMEQLLITLAPNLDIEQQIKLKNLIVSQTNLEVNKKIIRKFKHLGAFDVFEQRLIFQESLQLLASDFVNLGKENLLDTEVHQLIKVQIIEELLKLQYPDKIIYRNIWQKECEVDLKKLSFLEETEIYRFYQAKVLENNPNEQKQLLQEIQLKLMLLYPDFSIIDDYEKWYEILLNKTDEITAKLLEEQIKVWEI